MAVWPLKNSAGRTIWPIANCLADRSLAKLFATFFPLRRVEIAIPRFNRTKTNGVRRGSGCVSAISQGAQRSLQPWRQFSVLSRVFS